jgi:hypothetical protein
MVKTVYLVKRTSGREFWMEIIPRNAPPPSALQVCHEYRKHKVTQFYICGVDDRPIGRDGEPGVPGLDRVPGPGGPRERVIISSF